MLASYRLAIDFGTTNTTAALRRHGEPAMPLRLGAASNAIPSAVLLRGGDVVVGDEATRLAVLDPTSFERTPKRRLGQPAMVLGAQALDPASLVAAVLAHVIGTARAQSRGADPESILVTHPQAWGPHLVGELRRAASLAQPAVDGVELLSEPIAAASAYRDVLDGARAQTVAVADFGGGTFDVALLESTPGGGVDSLRVLDAAGLDPLGGDDFDALLEQWVFAQLRADGRSDLVAMFEADEHLGARLTLRDELRRAKHALSHHASAPVLVTVGAERVVVTITAAEFEAMIRPSIDRALDVTRRLLDGAEVDHLFLTGGSSLIPLVQREFQRLTGGRVGTLGDPKEITAVGALTAPVGAPERAEVPAQAAAPGRVAADANRPVLRFLPPPDGAPREAPPAHVADPWPPPADLRRAPAPHAGPHVGPDAVPHAGPTAAPHAAARPDGLVRAARVSLFVLAAACALLTLAFLANNESLGVPMLVVTPVACLASSVLVFRWFAREWVRSGAGPAVGGTARVIAGWWVPLANLYLAGRSLRQLLRAAGLGAAHLGRSSIWWALWVAWQVLLGALLVVSLAYSGSSDLPWLGLGAGFSVAAGSAAIVMASIVRDVTAALDGRLEEAVPHE
ncbi:Hsp70 family protein [Terrabacter sp. MAHUQ-38]|uniref:Hsp70 family protein n=1 Tax=unclassified Terrabacter TaxID=2630222 RepID=UPI00165DE712|nr:Hsp70 family protein [Terrabacter sp. MAHUQ-38]MBC9820539.1 Hsp70 family protein [Terrabacter sp. MAHUQ-38]